MTLLGQPSLQAVPATTTPPASAAARFDLQADRPLVSVEDLPPQGGPQRSRPNGWDVGRPLMQGLIGATLYQQVERTGGSGPPVDGSDDSQMPTIGGGAQWKLGGEKIDFGLEALLAFSWQAGATAFASTGGGAVVAVDVDLFLFDLYGGPFASVFLGDRLRAYVGAGPMMQWGSYDQSGSALDGSGSGFGLGVYARTGLEVLIGSGTLVGFGVRWSDSTIDLSGGQGDLELDGLQLAVTFSYFN
jgi:hypothetical protein